MPTREETQEETREATHKQTREQIIALAERLARRERFDPSWITYPRWTGHSPDLAPILEKADKFKTWAKAILEGEQRPPPWLVNKEPERWIRRREVKTAPAPATLCEADAYLQRRAYPLIAAWLLRATSPSPPPTLARPPPLRSVWRSPQRIDRDACPVLPPVRQRETRSVSRDVFLENKIAVQTGLLQESKNTAIPGFSILQTRHSAV